MTDQPTATDSRARLLLLSVLSLGVLIFGIVAMHAHMAGDDAPIGDTMTSTVIASHGAAMNMTPTATPAASVSDVMQHGMGGMSAMDCLLLGMMCLFGMVTLVLLIALSARFRSLLRRRLAMRPLAAHGWLHPPEPPSLLVLSISRT